MSIHEEDVLGKAYDARLMRRLLRYLRPYRPQVALALVAIISASVLQLAQPYLMKLAIDRYIASGDLAGLDRIALAFLAILVGVVRASSTLQTWLLQMTGQRIMFDMRMEIYGHLQRLDLQFYDRNPVGRLMTRVTTDVDVSTTCSRPAWSRSSATCSRSLGIMIVMLSMDWRLALVAFAVLPLIVLVTQWFRRNVRESYRTVRRLDRAHQRVPAGAHHRMATVQLFRREARSFARFDDDQPAAPRRQHRVDLLLRRVLSGDRGRSARWRRR